MKQAGKIWAKLVTAALGPSRDKYSRLVHSSCSWAETSSLLIILFFNNRLLYCDKIRLIAIVKPNFPPIFHLFVQFLLLMKTDDRSGLVEGRQRWVVKGLQPGGRRWWAVALLLYDPCSYFIVFLRFHVRHVHVRSLLSTSYLRALLGTIAWSNHFLLLLVLLKVGHIGDGALISKNFLRLAASPNRWMAGNIVRN